MELDGRQQRGLEIAATKRITKKGAMWVVPSQSNRGRYGVTIDGDTKHCTCPDFEERQRPCKHVYAVEFVLKRETVTDGDGTTTVTETAAFRVTYKQDWTNYNRAQTVEKEMVCGLLHDLCAALPELPQTNGRPRLPIADTLFCAAFKVYTGFSSRRFATDVREAATKGLISRAPHFNTVLDAIDDEKLTPIIRDLITQSAVPLKAIETDFAPDSTGFTSTQLLGTWRTAKYGAKEARSEHDWLKLHAMVGTKTNIVVAVEVTERNSQDSPQFAPLVETTTAHFNVERIEADKAYSSFSNLELVESKGAVPYIPFKSYAVASGKSATWDRLLGFYLLHREEFLGVYHRRSNAESCFSALKRLFGDNLRSRTRTAQINEVLLKVLCYNLTVLVHSIFEFGVSIPGLSACTESGTAARQVTAA